MASSICQTNPLSAKFFIFFTEMLLALRISNGSVLPCDSWSLPSTPIIPASHLSGSGSSTDCASLSDQRISSSPVKDVNILRTRHASNFLKSILLGEYPIVKVDSDNESCKEDDVDNDVEDEKYDNYLNENEEDGDGDGDGENEDENEDKINNDEEIKREKEAELPRSLSKSSRRSTPEFSRGRNRSPTGTSSINIGGTLIDALSAEGKEKGEGEEVEVDVKVDVEIEGVQHNGRRDGEEEKEEAEEDESNQEEEDEENDEEEDKGEEDEVEEVNYTMSGALNGDEKHSAMLDDDDDDDDDNDDDDITERKKLSIKTISPHTPSPTSLHSPPLKITEALRFLSAQKSNSAVWDQHAGLYALMSLVHLYFTNCASDWNVKEGEEAIQMCQSVHAVVEKKARHSSSSDFNDVSGMTDSIFLQSMEMD